jgi:hypothetical protein
MNESTKKTHKKRAALWVILAVVGFLLGVSFFVPLSPTKSIAKMIGYVLMGRIHFPSERVGEVVTDKDGNSFTVFREVVVDPAKGQPEQPGATLILHFRVSNMTPAVNEFYSVLPLPLYLGDPGFRRKLFTINGEYCQSIYQWDTVEDAKAYMNSMAVKTVSGRSVPGSFSYEIIDHIQ